MDLSKVGNNKNVDFTFKEYMDLLEADKKKVQKMKGNQAIGFIGVKDRLVLVT